MKDPARERHRVTLDSVLSPDLARAGTVEIVLKSELAGRKTIEVDWGAPAAWELRDEFFDGMSVLEIPYEPSVLIVVTMEYEAPGDRWLELRNAWLEIDHRSVLAARHIWKSKLLLEYAALNWKHPILDVGEVRAEKTAGTWLIDLADTYRALSKEHSGAMHLFWNPVIRIDLDERPRLMFMAEPAPPGKLAPELHERRPKWDQRTLVYQVGSLMTRIADVSRSDKLRALVDRCLEVKPSKRWTLDELVAAAERDLGVNASVVRDPERRRVYRLLETGLSWLEANDSQRALDAFTSYMREPLSLLHREMAEWGVAVARKRLGMYSSVSPWAKAVEAIDHRMTTPDDVPMLVEEASRALRSADPGHAAALVSHVLKHAPDHREAHRILVEVYLANEDPEKAMSIADELVAGADDALAQYLRGKCLLALRRLHEARAAFDLAIQRDPKMLEAMLLRREVDRTILATRDAVGEQGPQTIDIPPALADLRAVLLSGDTKRAIGELSKRPDDADAQLVLARFHQFDGDHYNAAHVYDVVASRWPEHRVAALLGKANALLDFGYHQSALAMFDSIVAEKPTDLDASEGRARALAKLGRTGEAAAEFRRFLGLATAGSDLRVRVAQAWLDAHPL